MKGTHFKHDQAFHFALFVGGCALFLAITATAVLTFATPQKPQAPVATSPKQTAVKSQETPKKEVTDDIIETTLYIPPQPKIKTTLTIVNE